MHAKRSSTQTECSELLGLIGSRVRSLRTRRGMTRKSLVAESRVSERHLAQLEMGRGNISIALLERVARALETDLGDLVRGGQGETIEQILINEQLRDLPRTELKSALELLHKRYFATTGMRQRIALIGLRGAGKTTLGKMLARHRNVPFVQLAAEIERLAGMDASEIFEFSGQAGYRRLEEKALTETLADFKACVIEVGGSIVVNQDSFQLLLSSCCVVWIRALPEQHMQRVIDQGDLRPMAGNEDAMSDLKRILQEREPFYTRAHYVLDTAVRSVEDSVQELAKITRFEETNCQDQKMAAQ